MLIINIYRAGRGKISYPPAASDDCLGIGVYGHRTLAACSVAILTTPARFKKKKQYLLSADAQTMTFASFPLGGGGGGGGGGGDKGDGETNSHIALLS